MNDFNGSITNYCDALRKSQFSDYPLYDLQGIRNKCFKMTVAESDLRELPKNFKAYDSDYNKYGREHWDGLLYNYCISVVEENFLDY